MATTEFADISKVFANIFVHLVGRALSCAVGGGGREHMTKYMCLVAQHANWNMVVLTLTHFQCCTTLFNELHILRLLRNHFYELFNKYLNNLRICYHEEF